MKVTLSFEESSGSDVSIMVDALRASTTITLSLDKFDKIIPCFSPQEAFKLKEEFGGLIAGERGGKQIEGFDIGNSPIAIRDLKTDEKTLILTTSNGTRILENMNGKVLVGSLVNAKAVALKSIQLADTHIDVVMAGWKGNFALEDFLASGEILNWICNGLNDYELSEYGKAAIIASRDDEEVKKGFFESGSGKRLAKLNYENDIEYCCKKNICENVGIYENNTIKLL